MFRVDMDHAKQDLPTNVGPQNSVLPPPETTSLYGVLFVTEITYLFDKVLSGQPFQEILNLLFLRNADQKIIKMK